MRFVSTASRKHLSQLSVMFIYLGSACTALRFISVGATIFTLGFRPTIWVCFWQNSVAGNSVCSGPVMQVFWRLNGVSRRARIPLGRKVDKIQLA